MPLGPAFPLEAAPPLFERALAREPFWLRVRAREVFALPFALPRELFDLALEARAPLRAPLALPFEDRLLPLALELREDYREVPA